MHRYKKFFEQDRRLAHKAVSIASNWKGLTSRVPDPKSPIAHTRDQASPTGHADEAQLAYQPPTEQISQLTESAIAGRLIRRAPQSDNSHLYSELGQPLPSSFSCLLVLRQENLNPFCNIFFTGPAHPGSAAALLVQLGKLRVIIGEVED